MASPAQGNLIASSRGSWARVSLFQDPIYRMNSFYGMESVQGKGGEGQSGTSNKVQNVA